MYSRKSLRRALVVDLRAVVSKYRESDARKKKIRICFSFKPGRRPEGNYAIWAIFKARTEKLKLIYISSLQDLLQYKIFGDRSKCYVVIVPRLFVV